MINLSEQGTGQVVVTDIKMPFWSMVTFMVKAAVAAIPALLILFFSSFGFVVIGIVILAAFGFGLEGLKQLIK